MQFTKELLEEWPNTITLSGQAVKEEKVCAHPDYCYCGEYSDKPLEEECEHEFRIFEGRKRSGSRCRKCLFWEPKLQPLKEMDELVNDFGEHSRGRDHHRVIQEKINELIRAINEMKK